MLRKVLPRVFVALLVSSLLAANILSQQVPEGDEKFLFDAVNHERASERLAPLKWDAALAAAARTHAHKMVERHSLSHQLPGEPDLTKRSREAGAHFSMLAENIALAESINELHIGWMNSIPHRNNILNPRLTAIGIAVELRGKEYFAVQDFSTSVEQLSKEEQEKKVGELLRARGLKIAGDSTDARKACDSAPKPSNARSFAVLHFETSNLNELPDQVAHAVRSGSYQTAAVGACNAVESNGFALFRIAVLLY